MNKELPPCQQYGFKVGDRFKVIAGGDAFTLGSTIELVKDDNTDLPGFILLEGGIDSDRCVFDGKIGAYEWIHNIEKLHHTLDGVDHPEHYNQGGIECIDALQAALTPEEFKGFLKGNAIKYLWRMGLKGKPLVDVQKAQWCIDKLASTLQESE